MITLSNTRIEIYSICPKRYYYRYVEGLEPIIRSTELFVGSLWHEALETYYSTREKDRYNAAMEALRAAWTNEVETISAYAQIWDEDYARYDEVLALVRDMLEYYDSIYGYEELSIMGTEVPVEAKILRPGGKRAMAKYTGVVDMIEARPDGIYIWEHKTMSSFGNNWYYQIAIDRQPRRYAWAYQEQTGNEVKGVIINAVLKRVPQRPRQLKKGELSRDKRLNTTRELYLQAINEYGLNPSDYADILDHLPGADAYIRRETLYLSQNEIAEAGEELYWIYRRMTTDIPPIPTPSPLCTHLRPCPYRTLCIEDTPEARMAFRVAEERR